MQHPKQATNPHILAHYTPPNDPLKVIHEDDYLLLIDKPAGLLTVPGKDPAHHDCLEARAKEICPQARIVHRLDMATSGLLVLAKTQDAHRHLGLQFEKRQIKKTYVAIVHGVPATQKGVIDLPMRCDWERRPIQRVDFDLGKSAITHWECGETDGGQTAVTLFPKTGRSHQLRVHMDRMGHPIVGDPLYGPLDGAPRMMLHAKRLELRHPSGGAWHCFEQEAEFTVQTCGI